MRSNILLSLSLCTSTLAAAQVVSMFIPDNEDGQPLAGKVIGTEADTTTYAITCADSVKTCEIPSSVTLIQAPSTLSLMADAQGHDATVACEQGDKSATCSVGLDGNGWGATTTYAVQSYAVTVTGSSSSTSTSASASTTPTNSAGSTSTEGETDGPGNGVIDQISKMSFGAAAVVMGVAVVIL